MLADMQQEGVASVLLPLPAYGLRVPVLPCGGPVEQVHCAVGGHGGVDPRVPLALLRWEGARGWGWWVFVEKASLLSCFLP